MTNYEIASIAIDTIGLIGVISSIAYAALQLRQNRIIHQRTLDWNRVTLTEAELSNKADSQRTVKLSTEFSAYVSTNTDQEPNTIPLAEILDAINDGRITPEDIHHVLNRYERICRGVNCKLYDEQYVLLALRMTMIKVLVNYKEYISYRRLTTNPNAWIQFESLMNEWNQADLKQD